MDKLHTNIKTQYEELLRTKIWSLKSVFESNVSNKISTNEVIFVFKSPYFVRSIVLQVTQQVSVRVRWRHFVYSAYHDRRNISIYQVGRDVTFLVRSYMIKRADHAKSNVLWWNCMRLHCLYCFLSSVKSFAV